MAQRLTRRAPIRPKGSSPTKCPVTQGIFDALYDLSIRPGHLVWGWGAPGQIDNRAAAALIAHRLAYVVGLPRDENGNPDWFQLLCYTAGDVSGMVTITELGRDQLAYWTSKGWVA